MGSENRVDILKFKNIAELGNHMYEIASDGESITAVLFYEDVVKLMRWLMQHNDVGIGDIKIIENYESEYYVTLDEFLYLNINTVVDKREKIVKENTDYMLFDGYAANNIALHNDDCIKYEIQINECDDDNICGECCEDCSNCSQRENIDAFSTALDLFDYVLNHYND